MGPGRSSDVEDDQLFPAHPLFVPCLMFQVHNGQHVRPIPADILDPPAHFSAPTWLKTGSTQAHPLLKLSRHTRASSAVRPFFPLCRRARPAGVSCLTPPVLGFSCKTITLVRPGRGPKRRPALHTANARPCRRPEGAGPFECVRPCATCPCRFLYFSFSFFPSVV